MNVALLLTLSLISDQNVLNIGRDFVKTKGTERSAKHTPLIHAPGKVQAGEWFEVKIIVGTKLHPSKANDFVRQITLFADGVEISRAVLHPTMSKPEVTFVIALPDQRKVDGEGTVVSRSDRKVQLRAVQQPNTTAAWWSEHEVLVRARK